MEKPDFRYPTESEDKRRSVLADLGRFASGRASYSDSILNDILLQGTATDAGSRPAEGLFITRYKQVRDGSGLSSNSTFELKV